MKKIIGGLIVGLILIPLTSSATVNTLEELRAQINSLLAMVAQLQTQLAAQTGSSGSGFCSSFNMDLKIGDRGTEVARLHAALEKDGFAIPDSEKPQREGETANDTRFGEATASKVSAFQEKYRSEILTPAGLSNGTGYLGARTRAKLNALYGCDKPVVTPNPPVACTMEAMLCPDGKTYVGRTGPSCQFSACPTTTSASNLYINLDGNNSSSQVVNSGSSNVNVGSFKISSQNGDTTIQNIRFGMTTYPFCPGKSYSLYDGNTLLSSVTSTDSGCNFFFNNLNYTIPTNTAKLLHVKMDISPETMSGQFAIQMKEVGTKYSSKISGLPVTANPVNIVGSTQTPQAPTVYSIEPKSASVGSTVYVYGSNFNSATFVGIDGVNGVTAQPSSINIISSNILSFVVPSLSVGTHTVAVAEKAGPWNLSSPVSLTVVASPVTVTKPDLIVGGVACEPLNININENKIFCQVTVWNNSSVDVTQPFDVNIQGSAVTINGLKAQERKTVKNPSPFGFSVAGTHTLNFPIDIWNSVNESDESNNSHSMPIVIGSAPVQAPTGVLSFYKNSFDFSYTKGDYLPPLQLLTFTNNSNVNINYNLSVPSKPSWLNASYATDTLTISPGTPTSVLATVSPENLNPGSYSTNLVISGNFVGSPIYIPINLTVK